MTDMPWKLMQEGQPQEGATGWYAVILCWEPEEGLIPAAEYWTGHTFGLNHVAVTYYSPQTFPDEETAKAWAYQHDLER